MIQRLVSKNWFRLSLIFIVSFSISLGIASLVRAIIFAPQVAEAEPDLMTTEPLEKSELVQPPTFISFQNIVDTWVEALNTNASVGVSIYDLDNQQIAAEYNTDATLSSVALSELINKYLEQNDTTQEIATLIDQLELSETSADGAYSNAQDAVTFLQYLWQHNNLTSSAWASLQDDLVGQVISETGEDLRQGIARGIPTALVYAQTSAEILNDGSPVYSCVGFIEIDSENRHYAFVLFGNLTDEVAEQLGEAIDRELQINHG